MVEKSSHEFIPVQEVLSVEESKKILTKLNLRAENLPKLLSSDPQAIFLKAKPGDVVLVKRNDYGKEYLYYRFVVDG